MIKSKDEIPHFAEINSEWPCTLVMGEGEVASKYLDKMLEWQRFKNYKISKIASALRGLIFNLWEQFGVPRNDILVILRVKERG